MITIRFVGIAITGIDQQKHLVQIEEELTLYELLKQLGEETNVGSLAETVQREGMVLLNHSVVPLRDWDAVVPDGADVAIVPMTGGG